MIIRNNVGLAQKNTNCKKSVYVNVVKKNFYCLIILNNYKKLLLGYAKVANKIIALFSTRYVIIAKAKFANKQSKPFKSKTILSIYAQMRFIT